jgi:hypothetical protein
MVLAALLPRLESRTYRMSRERPPGPIERSSILRSSPASTIHEVLPDPVFDGLRSSRKLGCYFAKLDPGMDVLQTSLISQKSSRGIYSVQDNDTATSNTARQVRLSPDTSIPLGRVNFAVKWRQTTIHLATHPWLPNF